MKDFINWLFHGATDPLWMMLFIVGAVMVGIVVLLTLFVIAWPFGVLAVFGLFFGAPYLAYRKAKKDE